MPDENPTAGDSGASITDRIEAYLAADDEPNTQESSQADTQGEKPQKQQTVETDEGDQQQDQGPQVTTADLAKYLGIDESALDVDEDGTIKVKTKIDGAEGSAKFKDLLAAHQKQGHADKVMREAAEQRQAVERKAQEVEQQAQAKLQQIEQLGNLAAQELMRDFQSIPWDDLKAQDPGRWAALRQEFQERNGKLQAVFQTVQQQAQQRAIQAEQKRQEFVAQQAERLPEVIPEWKDPEVANKERGEIRAWATKAGFDPKELDGFVLAHHVGVMRKAMLFDKLQEAKVSVEKQVRQAPKLVKPGESNNVDPKAMQLRNLKDQFRKSGGKRGIEELLIASGKV